MLWLAALVGCTPPTVIGLRTDAVAPPAGAVEVAASAGAGAAFEGESTPSGGGAASLAIGLADRVTLVPGVGQQGGLTAFDLSLRVHLLPPEALRLSLLAGTGVVTSWEQGGHTVGLYGGWVLSRAVAPDVRLYGGGTVNPVFHPDLDDPVYLNLATGASWRPDLGRGSGLLAVELFWIGPVAHLGESGAGALVTAGFATRRTDEP